VIYLVRHAHAGRKDGWTAPDVLRPLSEYGREEAAGLVAGLRGLPVARILSSPATRCLQTVEPLARQRSLPVEVDDGLGVHATPAHARRLLDDPASSAAVLCTHGELIGQVLRQLEVDGLSLPGAPHWPKGSTWIIDQDGRGRPRASYLPPARVPAASQP
jgi:8-oxo-dGTP diphosphatase